MNLTKLLVDREQVDEYHYVLNSPIAQLVEQVTVNHWVPGSSPGRGAKLKKPDHESDRAFLIFIDEEVLGYVKKHLYTFKIHL